MFLDIPCIFGYLNGIQITGVPFENRTYVGNFTNMRDCANAVQSAESEAWAAIMESPYDEDGTLFDVRGTGVQFKCWAIDVDPDYEQPLVQGNISYMSCYLKGAPIY